MTEYLGIVPLTQERPSDTAGSTNICGRPGHNIITSCVEEPGHEGQHTYSPVSDNADKMSDRLEEVMRILTQSCPDYTIGDFMTPRPKCCVYHNAANTVMEAQKKLRIIKQ